MAVAAILLASLLVSGVLSGPLSFPDLTPRLSSEIRELINEVIDEGNKRKQTFEGQLHAEEVGGWAHSLPRLGQIAGVTIDEFGRPVIFHRGPSKWLSSTFNESFVYQDRSQGPIPVDTVLTLDPQTGIILGSWGRNLFYMPHGITICIHTGDVWITDVAMHQVFKFASGDEEASLRLGVEFEPGSDGGHFCQPTSVAVASTGDVFIADGYCNARIMRFTSEGDFVSQMGADMGDLRLTLPHGIALLEERDAVCVADRETRRIVCLRAGLGLSNEQGGEMLGEFQDSRMGRTFGIASLEGLLFVVAGETEKAENMGFIIDPVAGKIIDEWTPQRGFRSPHAVAVAPETGEVYVTEIGPNRITKFVVSL